MARMQHSQETPKDSNHMVRLFGVDVEKLVRALDKGGRGGGGKDLLQHVWTQVLAQDVLRKYREKAASIQEVVTTRKYKDIISGAEAAAYLGVTHWAFRKRLQHRLFGDHRGKGGKTPEALWRKNQDQLDLFSKLEGVTARWAPLPLQGTIASTKAIFSTGDILKFEMMKPFRKQGDRGPLPEDVIEVSVSTEGKVTISFWAYLSRAVHNIYANYCRTQFRRNKERFLGTSYEGMMGEDSEDGLSWADRLADPSSEARVIMGAQALRAGAEAVAKLSSSFLFPLAGSKMTLSREKWASLNRSLYTQSFSIHQRVASMVLKLASTDAAKSFGHGIYRVLVDLGIEGMPPVRGETPKPRQSLPTSYGADWGQKAYRTILKYVHNDEEAEAVVMDYLVEFLAKDKAKVDKTKAGPQVLQFVMTSLVRYTLDRLRAKKRRPGEVSLMLEGEDGEERERPEIRTDVENVLGTLETFSEAWLSSLLERERPALDKIHPDAYDYLVLLLDSEMSDSEILGNRNNKPVGTPKLPYLKSKFPGGVSSSFWAPYKKKIFDFLKKVIQSGEVPMGGSLDLGAVKRLFAQWEASEKQGGDATYLLSRLEALLAVEPKASGALSLVRDAIDSAQATPDDHDERLFYVEQAKRELMRAGYSLR